MMAKANLPAFQFYPGDWRKDPGVQALTYEQRGIWLEVLCLMHESEERGCLVLNGTPMPDAAVARILGIPEADWKQMRSTLLAYGVASERGDGVLVNRRMVREEGVRLKRVEAGRKGGSKSRPSKREAKQEANGGSSVSSSSSTSSSSKSRAAPLPDEWKPGDGHRDLATQEGVDVTREATRFRDHATANGRTQKDWDAAFRNWLRKAAEFGAMNKGRTKVRPDPNKKTPAELREQAQADEGG